MRNIITSAGGKIVSAEKYRTIMADPPWPVNQTGVRGAQSHYALMSLDRIKSMPIADLCKENSHLYLWIPNGLLQEGLDVIKALRQSE